MPLLRIVKRNRDKVEINVSYGMSVMEVIRNGGIDEMLALCGGCASCATCHIHIDPVFLSLLPPMSDDENDLLDSSNYRTEQSRLSCQIPFTPKLDGLAITIAPED